MLFVLYVRRRAKILILNKVKQLSHLQFYIFQENEIELLENEIRNNRIYLLTLSTPNLDNI